MSAVLGNIVEKPLVKELNQIKFSNENAIDALRSIEKLNLKEINKIPSNERKTKSLFALNLERQGKLKSYFPLNNVHQIEQLKHDESIKKVKQHLINAPKIKVKKSVQDSKNENGDASQKPLQIITGDGLGNKQDVERIHLENLELLSKMKSEEILAEQQKLIQQLDPKILSFIRRRNKTNNTNDQEMSKIEDNSSNPKNYDREQFIEQLPFKPQKNWLHMDKIEYEKLEWMIKPTNPLKISDQDQKNKTASRARFDFEGNLIGPDQDIPVTKALHHHGSDPDQAGYTLDELFHLARSKLNQQKCLALETLSNILKKCHLGAYADSIKSAENKDEDGEEDECKNDKNNLLNQLIDGGILFLLRISLDDQTESIINISLNALKNLIQPVDQEDYLDFLFDTNHTVQTVSLFPFSSFFSEDQNCLKVDKNVQISERRELNELTDDEFIRHDLIRGLLRMNLIERFFYLLDKYRPSFTIDNILESIFSILFRCMRHSAELCLNFNETYSSFLQLVFKNFLPNFIDLNETNTTSQIIVNSTTHALKLVRLLACAGPSLAYRLYQKTDLKQKIINYLSLDENTTIKNDCVKLKQECLRLIKVFVVYSDDWNSQFGLNLIIDLYEILMNNLNSQIKLITKDKTNSSSYLISLITFFNCSMSKSKYLAIMKQNNQIVGFNISTSVFSIVKTLLIEHYSSNFSNSDKVSLDLNLCNVCMNFLCDYLDTGAGADLDFIEKKLGHIECIVKNVYDSLFSTGQNKIGQFKFDNLIMSKLVSNSVYSENMIKKLRRVSSNNLTFLPTIIHLNNDNEQFIFNFLSSFLNLYLLCLKFRMKTMDDADFTQTRTAFLKNAYLKSYLKLFVENLNQNTQNGQSFNESYYNTRHECMFVYSLLKLEFHILDFEVILKFY